VITMAERRGRKPRVQQGLLSDLRRRITVGELQPGEQLPSQQSLVDHYQVSLVTVQRALTRLADEGFVRLEPRRGRFVADAPPTVRRYGLVFPGRPGPIDTLWWTRQHAAIRAAAQEVTQREPVTWVPYFDVHAGVDGPTRATEQVQREVEQGWLAGVFVVNPVLGDPDRWLRSQSWVPVVVPFRHGQAEPSVATYDRQGFADRALEHLVQRGCQRVLWLTMPEFSVQGTMHDIEGACRTHGMEMPRAWVVPADPFAPDWLLHRFEQLFSEAEEKPDGMVILDDHLVEPASAALQALGTRMPDDLAVVGHWNFPLRCEAESDLQLIGFDARDLLHRIDGFFQGRIEQIELVPARTAQEVMEAGWDPVPLADVCQAETVPAAS